MAAPLKPWERPGINFQSSAALPSNSMSSLPMDQDRISSLGAVGIPSTSASSPPQLPPRPSQQSFQSRLGYGGGYSGYSSYNSSPLGGYGGLYSSPYSSYHGYGYNRFNDLSGSTFARQAEESSRPAFESIESIVHAVSSVGMMLDSTFQAVYNSFRAVIGVADNFSRLKSQLIQVFSALAFIRTLRYFYRRLLELLRLRPAGEAERQWKKAFQEAAAAAASSPDGAPKKSTWPILMFFGIIMGGPYLIWKLISTFSGQSDGSTWATGEEDHFVGQALYDFQAQDSEEVSFSKGQLLKIAPKELQPRVRGWLLASSDGKKTGMVPANYLKVLGRKRGSRYNENEQLAQTANVVPTQNPEFTNTNRQIPTLNQDDYEKAFAADKMNLDGDNALNSVFDSGNQEAAEILSEVDKS